jgi:predicted nucleotide-binding protein (sugar kinase/HSP70/actin superfamily)
MVDAGGCCRVGQYEILIRALIEKKKIKDTALLLLSNDDGYAGLGIRFRLAAAKALYLFDVLDDVRSVIKALAVDRARGMEVFEREVQSLLGTFDGTNLHSTYAQLASSVKALSSIGLRMPLSKARYIGIVGEIFVRRDHFSLMGIPERLAEQGFVMLDAPVSEWVRYTDFLRDIEMYTAKHTFIGAIEALISEHVQSYHEKKVKRMLARTGLYEYELIDIRAYMAHSTHYFPLQLTGEPGLSSGSALYHFVDKYCGTISVGPFGCMNSRMTEAVATVEMTTAGKEKAAHNAGRPVDLGDIRRNVDVLPFLNVELDGNVFTQIEEARFETFLLQAGRLAQEMEKLKNGGNGAPQGTRHAADKPRRRKMGHRP